jgi:hypothetical protein
MNSIANSEELQPSLAQYKSSKMAFDRRAILGRFAMFGAALGFLLTVYYLKGLVRGQDFGVHRSPDHHAQRPDNAPLYVDTANASDDVALGAGKKNYWKDLSEGEARELVRPIRMLSLYTRARADRKRC